MNVMYGTTYFEKVESCTSKVFMKLTIERPFYEIVWQATQSTLTIGGLPEPPMLRQIKKNSFQIEQNK